MSASTQHLSSNSWRSLQDVSARVMYAEFVPNTTIFCCIAPSDCLENIFSTALCLLVWFSHVFPLYSYVWSWGMATCKVHIFHFSVQSVESSGSFSHPLWSRQCLEKHSPNVLLATKIYSLKKTHWEPGRDGDYCERITGAHAWVEWDMHKRGEW